MICAVIVLEVIFEIKPIGRLNSIDLDEKLGVVDSVEG